MSGKIICCCVALLIFTSVSAVKRMLNSISDLKSVRFGQSVPMESQELLRWFANKIEIDTNGVIQLNFDPHCDYGSHHYSNFERLLDELPTGYRYYTLGNVNQQTSLQLPSHRRNRARIIIRVRERSQTVDQVYITQHYQTYDYQRSEYDPEQTYLISTNLLREIRRAPMDNSPIHRVNASQSWDTGNRQAATRRNGQPNGWDSDWLIALVVVVVVVVVVFVFINYRSAISKYIKRIV